MTKTWIALLALGAAAVDHVVANEQRVVRMPMYRAPATGAPLRKRAAGAQSVTLGNAANAYLYYVNATVGTPGQSMQLQIDTGSSDVWMFSTQLCNSQSDLCEGGSFDSSKSSSFQQQGQSGAFEIQYVTPGSGVSGDYFTDDYSIGDIHLTGLTMAVATQAKNVNTGIMGIGFTSDESIVSNTNGEESYPSIIDVMVNESVIPSHAYSLYLDDREALTGAVLFGGYDTAKYTGPLTILEIQPDSQSGTISSFTVAWSFIGVSDGSGTTLLSNSDFPLPAVLDSGTSLTVVPQDIFQQLVNYFNATNGGDEYGYLVPCSNQNLPGTLDFGFGNANGGIVQVPFSELALPLTDENGNAVTFQDGTPACSFGVDVTGSDSPVLLGDTFLRSAYVIYDLEAQQIAIAQASFNATGSNVKEIPSGTNLASILGSAATVATGSTASQTASGLIPGIISRLTATSAPSATADSGSGTGLTGIKTTLNISPLATTAANAGKTSGTGATTSATHSGAAAAGPFRASSPDMTLCFVTAMALFASGAAMMAFF